MTAPNANAYDTVLYPSGVFPQTHPDRLATLATLFGMKPAPVERCRVLELGCGDGLNLISMAVGLGDSEFVGLDLAAKPIAAGKAMAEQLHLTNVALHEMDLMQTPEDLGQFDYIVSHGIYSWVPAEVRESILAISDRHLADSGVSYVSYNAYPGNHLRDMARGMMRYHAANFPDPSEQVRQARSLLKLLIDSKPKSDVYAAVLKQELDHALKRPDSCFYHDDLSPINHSVYFHEFAAHARRHGLQYLAEAFLRDLQIEEYPPNVAAVLLELEDGDVIVREQILDFLRGRSFRQTLLCRAGVPLDRTLNPQRLEDLYAAADFRPQSAPSDNPNAAETFLAANGLKLETNRPVLKAALRKLGESWPRALSFRELIAFVRDRLNTSASPAADAADDAGELAGALLQAALAGCAELSAHSPRFAATASDRPLASHLARLQLRNGDIVSTLRHTCLRVADSLDRHLIALLDGTRDRDALRRELRPLLESGAATIFHEGKAVTDLPQALRLLDTDLDDLLAALARLALLVT